MNSDRHDHLINGLRLTGEPDRCPADMELAAWLDDRLRGPELDAIDTHLAECADCRSAALDARAIARMKLEPAQQRVVERALATVPVSVSAPTPTPVPMPALVPASLWPLLRWPLAAAAVIVACVLGWHAGAGCAPPAVEPAPDLLAELSFGLMQERDELELAADLGLLGLDTEGVIQ